MHFDDLLGKLGEFGRYQKRIYFLMCLMSVIVGFHMVISVFLLGTGSHRCSIPEYPGDTYNIQDENHSRIINASIPSTTNDDGEVEYDQCERYAINITSNDRISNQKIKCDSWVYDKSIYESTFAAEKNLVCDKSLWTSNASMVFFFGFLIGALSLGWLSDTIGRKKTLCLCFFLLFVASLAVAWAPEYYTFCILRAIVGMACAGLFMSGFVLSMEMVGPSKRLWAGIVIDFFFALGLVILAGVAYAIRHWKYIEITLSAPIALFLLYWWFVPESPRWLVNQGRKEEAKVIIRAMAKENKVSISEKDLDNLECDENSSTGKLYHLFMSRVLLIRTLIIFFNWMVITLGYYGLSLNSGNLAGDFYLNFFLSGLVEIPAYALCLVLVDRIGRKKLHAACMVIGGLACLCTIFTITYLDKSLQPITVTLAMLGKIGISAGFALIYLWSAELYPTIVRNAGMGASSSCARIGAMISPYIADLSKVIDGDFGQAVPLVIFGGASVVAGVLALFLPETMNENLPETIEDGINFGKKNKKYEQKEGLRNRGFESDGEFQTKL